MSLEGELRVDVTWNGACVTAVKVRSTRPHMMSRLARGRSSAAVVSLASRLHAVCSGAHAAAAATACDVARGDALDPGLLLTRARMIDLEAIQEHCTRLGLHWSHAMQDTPMVPFVREVRAVVAPVLRHGARTAQEANDAIHVVARLVGSNLLGMSTGAWLDLAAAADLSKWSDRGSVAPARWWMELTRDFPRLGCCPVDLMPEVDSEALQRIIAPRLRASAQFAQCPDWDGRTVETGPLARTRRHPLVADALLRYGNSVAARLLARLTDVAQLCERDQCAPPTLVACGIEGDGYASAFTARGLLVHRAVLQEDVVDDYAIVAPTEWNFHPDGVFASALIDYSPENEASLSRAAKVLIQAIDPCVPCVVEIAHA